jgi:hypothetical protein
MKIKYSIIAVLFFLILVSVSQIFNIPPLERDVYPLYKSGYFRELDTEFDIIVDSFTEVKSMTDAIYGWVLLDDISKRHDIRIRVYDRQGYPMLAPGKAGPAPDPGVQKALIALDPAPVYSVKANRYSGIVPLKAEDRCRICHVKTNSNGTVGALTFSRTFDGRAYYSGERMIIFTAAAIALLALLVVVVRWDPEKNIKELFDKS